MADDDDDDDSVRTRRALVATMLGLGMKPDLLAVKLGVSVDTIDEDMKWMEANSPETFMSAQNQLHEALGIQGDIPQVIVDQLNSIYEMLDPDDLAAVMKSYDESGSFDLDSTKDGTDADEPLALIDDCALTTDERSEFEEIVGDLDDLGETVRVDAYLQAAKILSIQLVARPVAGGHLYARGGPIDSFLVGVLADVLSGGRRLATSSMVLGVTPTDDDDDVPTVPPVIIARADMLPSTDADDDGSVGDGSHVFTPSGIASIRLWIDGLHRGDPKALAYVGAIPVSASYLVIDDDGTVHADPSR